MTEKKARQLIGKAGRWNHARIIPDGWPVRVVDAGVKGGLVQVRIVDLAEADDPAIWPWRRTWISWSAWILAERFTAAPAGSDIEPEAQPRAILAERERRTPIQPWPSSRLRAFEEWALQGEHEPEE